MPKWPFRACIGLLLEFIPAHVSCTPHMHLLGPKVGQRAAACGVGDGGVWTEIDGWAGECINSCEELPQRAMESGEGHQGEDLLVLGSTIVLGDHDIVNLCILGPKYFLAHLSPQFLYVCECMCACAHGCMCACWGGVSSFPFGGEVKKHVPDTQPARDPHVTGAWACLTRKPHSVLTPGSGSSSFFPPP